MPARTIQPASELTVAVWLRAASVLCFCIFLAACRSESQAQEDDAQARVLSVTYSQVRMHGIEDTETGLATIHARRSPSIAAEIAGRLMHIHFDEGQAVLENDLLAEIDSRDYETDFERSEAEVSRIRVLVDQKERQLERQQRLHSNGHISSHVLEDVEAEFAALREELRAARSDHETAERRLSRTRVLAPYDGIVSARLASEGDFVDSGTVLVEMTTNGVLQVRIPLPESAANRLEKGQEVRLWHGNRPDEIHLGEVRQMAPEVDTDSRSVTAIAELDEAPENWRAGTSVNAKILLERREAILVPAESVVRRPAGSVAYVLEDNLAHERAVEIGRRTSEWIEITDGLATGDNVVIDGAGFLTDAIPVDATLQDWAPALAQAESGAPAEY